MASGALSPGIPPGAKEQTLAQMFADCRTGDIFILSGKKGVSFSSVVRMMSDRQSKYVGSHVGMSYNMMSLNAPDQIMIFESTQDYEPPDLSTGVPILKNGPKLSDLRQKLANYHGCWIAVRHVRMLEGDITKVNETMALCKRRMEQFITEVRHKPYESDVVELGFSVSGLNTTNSSEYFCTEVLADLLEAMGIIVKYKPANNYTVPDFQFFDPTANAMGLVYPFFYEEPIYTSIENL